MKPMHALASAIAALLLVTNLAHAKKEQHRNPKYKIIAYYIGMEADKRKYSPLDIDGSLITHLNYAFADIKDGEISLMNPSEEVDKLDNFGKLRQLKKANPHLKTLISVGGWTGSKEFSNVALTSETRAKFAQSAVAFIRKYGFDGVDIDWEFPVSGGDPGNSVRPEDKQNYTLFLKALRVALDEAGRRDKHKYLLTAALGSNSSFLGNTEMGKVSAILDWANIMTYDFSGHWNVFAGHNTPMHGDASIARPGGGDASIVDVVESTIKAGVPPGKLALGLAFYGYSWKQCNAVNNGQYQDCKGKGPGSWEEGALDYAEIEAKYVNKNGFVRYWNDVSKVPYLFNSESGGFITYDDPQSLDYKIDYLKSRGLAGAMFWELTGDRQFVLQHELAKKLLNGK